MNHIQWYDYLRMLTMLLALVSMYRLSFRAVRMWHDYTSRLKDLWWAMNALLLLLVEGSLEQIILDTTWGPRTLLSFFVTCITFRAVLRNEGFIKGERAVT